jgi:hypothetical protein
MNLNLMPIAIGWALIAVLTAGLALYRKLLTHHEDDYLHVHEGEARIVSQQFQLAHKVDAVDKWGKILTVVTAILGAAIAAAYLYQGYVQSLKLTIGG